MPDLHAEWPTLIQPDDNLPALPLKVLDQLIHLATLRFAIADKDLRTLVAERDRRSAAKRAKGTTP